MNNVQIKIAIALTAGLCIGGGTGYLIAEHRLRRSTEAEIEEVKSLYRRLRNADAAKAKAEWNPEVTDEADDETITAEDLRKESSRLGYINWEDAKEILRKDPNYIPPEPQDEQDGPGEGVDSVSRYLDVNSNLPDDPNDPRNWERDPERPYVITEEEFRIDFPEHEKLSITYYKGDDTLSDEKDQFIPDPDGTVLIANLEYFGMFSDDPRILHVRNERVGADFEVALNDGSYTRDVLGFDIEDKMVRESKASLKKMRHRE